jgi:hypothetical protein
MLRASHNGEQRYSVRMRLSFFAIALLMCASARAQHPAITKATADANGDVHVVMSSGREHVVHKHKGQVAADGVKLSTDGTVAGWLAEYPNCCTSYSVPFDVVLYRVHGGVLRLGDGAAISDWRFVDEGAHVAYLTDTVHSNLNPWATLVDVKTGKTLAKYGRGKDPIPAWASSFADQLTAPK